MPRTLVQKVGVLFPFTKFLRLDNQMEMTSTCGGISAIIAILLVLAIFISELVSVFSMNKITSSSESALSLQPPMVNITTVQTDPMQIPYMVGLSYKQDFGFTSNAVTTARFIHVQGSASGNRTYTQTAITLEPCTPQHFSKIPGIQQQQNNWGIANWTCLPLNQTWTIGGDFQLSSQYRRVDINMTCTQSQNFVDCGYYKVYTLNAFVNPSDPLNPTTYYISQDTILVKAQAYYEYSSKLNQNNLTVDQSVTPQVKLVSQNSFEANPAIVQSIMETAPRYQTVFKIQSSGRVTLYNRSFYKLLAALSFVGGIFSSILAIFFFMTMFMRFMFEMRFAEYYFNSDDARDVGFFSWIQQALFSVLQGTSCEPNWEVAAKRLKLRQTVNKVLDIFYLHKRIAFLEKAISILLQRHQIKGLHLAQNISKEDSEIKYKNYKLRDRVIIFLSKYSKKSSFGSMSDLQVGTNKNMNTSSKKIIKNKSKMEIQAEEERRKEIESILEKQVRNIGEMPEEELDQDGLVDEMNQHISRLFEEGQRQDGNERSKKICDMLEGWLMHGLKIATKEKIFTHSIIKKMYLGSEEEEKG